jgi:electron transport complex protein RnfG
MNTPLQSHAAWPMYRALVGIGMLCGLLIAIAYQGTRPTIEANRAAFLERAVFTVLDGATRRVTLALIDGTRFEASDAAVGDRVHAGFGDDGRLIGVAIEASGMGYADTISLLYGYAPSSETIVGLQVLTSKETPGLGDKIEKDPRFVANFSALDVRRDPSGTALMHRIETVKQGEKTHDWQIDGITGATISSKAIGDILASSTARWIPLIARQSDQIVERGADDGA